MNSERTRLSSKMLMIGQLKKRTPRTNKNIQTSLLISDPAFDINPRTGPLPPKNENHHAAPWPGRVGYRKSLS
jgi:hypothetical protein